MDQIDQLQQLLRTVVLVAYLQLTYIRELK